MKRTVVVGILLLILVTAGLIYYRDSLISKRRLSDPNHAHGVVFYDRWRATPGYHLIDDYVSNYQCRFIDGPFEFNKVILPGSFCTFLSDGSYLSLDGAPRLSLYDKAGALKWAHDIDIHHDVWVDEEKKQIFVIYADYLDKRIENYRVRLDGIRGYDFRGEVIFEWRLRDHFKEFESHLGHSPKRFFVFPRYQYTHFNSVQILPPNPFSKQNVAFREGNILVNDFENKIIFIIDSESHKIVWHHNPVEWGNAHQVRMNDEGLLVFLANTQSQQAKNENSNLDYSSINFLNPITGKLVHKITLEPKENFFTNYWGSMEPLPNEQYLVTNSRSGSAFEVDKSGRILWEWVGPRDAKGEIYPVYRVSVVPKDRVDALKKSWLRF